MKFDLVRPCAKCPFRRDIRPFLTPARARQIARDLLSGKTFTCHETIDYDAAANDSKYLDPNEQHCAGALIMLERADRPNQMMRWMERINCYDLTKLDLKSPVFPNFKSFVEAQADHKLLAKPNVTAIVKKIR